MPDFETREIQVRYYSADYGPHVFDFTDALPSGVTISSASVKSYLTKVDQADDLSAKTETTSELIDAQLTAASGNYNVNVYFNYPSTTAWLGGAKHTLVFELTLSNSAKHNYFFHYVRVMY